MQEIINVLGAVLELELGNIPDTATPEELKDMIGELKNPAAINYVYDLVRRADATQ